MPQPQAVHRAGWQQLAVTSLDTLLATKWLYLKKADWTVVFAIDLTYQTSFAYCRQIIHQPPKNRADPLLHNICQ